MFVTDYQVFMVARLAENLTPEGFVISFFPNTTTQEEKTIYHFRPKWQYLLL